MFDVFTLRKPDSEVMIHPLIQYAESIDDAKSKSRTRYCWIIDGRNDYSNFNFHWEPTIHQSHQIHIFPSQHQKNGGTYLVPKYEKEKRVFNYNIEIIVPRVHIPKMVYIDHGNYVMQPANFPAIGHYTHFVNDYLGTLKRAVKKMANEEFVWVTSSLCEYHGFDFTWHPEEWQEQYLHVFPSNDQKFGDTFYINVKDFLSKCGNVELLEWYETLCFQEKSVFRQTPNLYLHMYASQADAVKQTLFDILKNTKDTFYNDPVRVFARHIDHIEVDKIPTVNIWRPETRPIMPLNRSGSVCIMPKEAMAVISDEVYDYPHINKSLNNTFEDKPLDIFFLSNGEERAVEHYRHLIRCTSHLPNVKTWIADIDGRVRAYQHCAQRAMTDWFFVVSAKLKVDENFDWAWQPDRLQRRKHYIFYANNPVTGDTYGHMAMIAYNRELVLEHDGKGIDFAMHQDHEVIPIRSGKAIYADEPWAAWRTAFREVIKLQISDDIESRYHLEQWMNATHEWTVCGVDDAIRYYKEVNGDMDKLLLSYEWSWLRRYFDSVQSHHLGNHK